MRKILLKWLWVMFKGKIFTAKDGWLAEHHWLEDQHVLRTGETTRWPCFWANLGHVWIQVQGPVDLCLMRSNLFLHFCVFIQILSISESSLIEISETLDILLTFCSLDKVICVLSYCTWNVSHWTSEEEKHIELLAMWVILCWTYYSSRRNCTDFSTNKSFYVSLLYLYQLIILHMILLIICVLCP